MQSIANPLALPVNLQVSASNTVAVNRPISFTNSSVASQLLCYVCEDTTATMLTLTCGANLTATVGSGQTTATVNYILPVVTTTCPGGAVTLTLVSGLPSGAAFPVGTTSVCYAALDECGNTSSCCFNVTVAPTGTSALTLNCPGSVTATANSGQTTAVVNYELPVASTTCPGGTVTLTLSSGLPSGAAFPVGLTVVCYVAQDECGNISTCCLNVTVLPASEAVLALNCGGNLVATASLGQTTTVVNYNLPTATTTCQGGAVSLALISGLPSGAAFPIGTTSVCYLARDKCGNTSTCCFNVTVVSGTDAMLTLNCGVNLSATASPGQTTAVVSYNLPTATTTCQGGVVTLTLSSGLPSGASFPVGNTTVCYQAQDQCGNTAICCFNVTVAPAAAILTVNCGTDLVATANAGQTTAVVTYNLPVATTTCPNSAVSLTLSSGLPSGGSFPLGVTTVCYIAQDQCGNTFTCCFNVTVLPGTPTPLLTLSCGGNIVVTANPGQSTAVVGYNLLSASTTCPGGAVTLTLSSGLPTGAAFPVGVTAVCYIAQDQCGNIATCCFNVTVLSGDILTLSCETDITATTNPGQPSTIIDYDASVATTTCPGGAVTLTLSSGLPPGGLFPVGTTTVCYLAQDQCGNTASCCFNVTVLQGATLALTCTTDISATSASGQPTAVVNYALPAATSTCPGSAITVTLLSGPAVGAAFPVGTTNVCYIAQDQCGNTAICCFNVTILQGLAPNPIALKGPLPFGGQNLSLYPNPTSGRLSIDLTSWDQQSVKIEVLNAQGRLVQTLQVEATVGAQNVDLDGRLPNGLYQLVVRPNNGRPLAEPFILQRN